MSDDWAAVPCNSWRWRKNNNGYGVMNADGSSPILAHRAAWMFANGPIPWNLCVLHRCDNPACVEVAHLFLGTRTENNFDRDFKQRGSRGSKNGNTTVTEAAVAELRKRVAAGVSPMVAAIGLGVSTKNAYSIANRRTWKHVGDVSAKSTDAPNVSTKAQNVDTCRTCGDSGTVEEVPAMNGDLAEHVPCPGCVKP